MVAADLYKQVLKRKRGTTRFDEIERPAASNGRHWIESSTRARDDDYWEEDTVCGGPSSRGSSTVVVIA